MPPRLFLIFNHAFTQTQEADARASLGVKDIIAMPEPVKTCWGNVPPELKEIGDYLAPVKNWLAEHAAPSDYVLIQGDFGACYLMVRFAVEKGLIPVYATTSREAAEEHQPDGSVKMTHHFKHRRFRVYGK